MDKNINPTNMTNEIKKALYKEKPKAKLFNIRDGKIGYTAETEKFNVDFSIPFSEVGSAIFNPEMDAQLLIRWIEGYQTK